MRSDRGVRDALRHEGFISPLGTPIPCEACGTPVLFVERRARPDQPLYTAHVHVMGGGHLPLREGGTPGWVCCHMCGWLLEPEKIERLVREDEPEGTP